MTQAMLVLADGTSFEGEAAGWWDPNLTRPATGEVVFNTSMTGYQEILTDPSYAGQIVCFTYPHIGNYGVASQDYESSRAWVRGVIVRDLSARPSNWRSTMTIGEFLDKERIPAIVGVDTRRLTRHIRQSGAMPAAFGPVSGPGGLALSDLAAAAAGEAGTDGVDLASQVTTPVPYSYGAGRLSVVAYDFGIKRSILSQLGLIATVEVVPAATSAEEVLGRRPDGVFLSNGPGDPAAVGYASDEIAKLLGKVPVFGICLGHQLMAIAMGGSTYKLAFGHHGANHPVRRVATSRVEITAQNHNYAVAAESLTSAEVTHVNLNDAVVEGFALPELSAFGVQYHPEAGPGPHDARYLFSDFEQLMARGV